MATPPSQLNPRASKACAHISINYFTILEARRREDGTQAIRQNHNLFDDLLHDDDEGSRFFLLAPHAFDIFHRGEYDFTPDEYSSLLDRFQDLLHGYKYSKSVELQLLALHMLCATVHHWSRLDDADNIVSTVQDLLVWFTEMILKSKIQSWVVKDRLVQFVDLYSQEDPLLSWWPEMEEEGSPIELLAHLAADPDVRVRFRVATSSARVVDAACNSGTDPESLYDLVRRKLCNVLSE